MEKKITEARILEGAVVTLDVLNCFANGLGIPTIEGSLQKRENSNCPKFRKWAYWTGYTKAQIARFIHHSLSHLKDCSVWLNQKFAGNLKKAVQIDCSCAHCEKVSQFQFIYNWKQKLLEIFLWPTSFLENSGLVQEARWDRNKQIFRLCLAYILATWVLVYLSH